MKYNLEEFIKAISDLGILITDASWWCFVDANDPSNSGCPHGMGGPKADYYDGWFSELQNDLYELDDKAIEKVLLSNDKELIYSINMNILDGINNMLKEPFKYTPMDFIEDNKCVNPALWLCVPENWKRKV